MRNSNIPAELIISVFADCTRRTGFSPAKIRILVIRELRRNPIQKDTNRLIEIEFITRKKRLKRQRWKLFCFWVEGYVDVVDAAPIQTDDRSRRWLSLVDKCFAVYAMRWRLSLSSVVPQMMVTAGGQAIEDLKSRVADYVDLSAAKSDFSDALANTESVLDLFHRSMSNGNTRDAKVKLETALYSMHKLIYDIGYYQQILL